MRLEWNRRLVLSLALGMALSLGTVLPTLASSAVGGTCFYVTSGDFIGTYCPSDWDEPYYDWNQPYP
jgi:hypothetical protein